MRYQFTSNQIDNQLSVTISGELNIYCVSELLNKFNECRTQSEQIIVDLSEITAMDTAGLQLLLYLKKTVAPSGKFNLKSHSKPVLKLLDLYGLVGFFGDPIAMKSSWKNEFHFAYGVKKHKERV